MVEKVKVACAARRRDPNAMLVIARTDARQTDGFEGAVRRGLAYADAGADIVFLEALEESEAEMREACARIRKPMMANMADGGKTPIRSKAELKEIGYALAIFPSITGLASAAATEKALTILKQQGTSFRLSCRSIASRRNSLIGFEDVWAFERRWARPAKERQISEARGSIGQGVGEAVGDDARVTQGQTHEAADNAHDLVTKERDKLSASHDAR